MDGVWGQGSSALKQTVKTLQKEDFEGIKPDPSQFWAAILVVFGKLLASALAFAAGGSGGILMPVIICGGVVGYCVRCVIFSMFSLPVVSSYCVSFGIAGAFSALTRLPLTATVLAVEMTGVLEYEGGNIIFPILFSAILGTRVAGIIQHETVFERMMLQDGIDPTSLGQQIHRTVHDTTAQDEHSPFRASRRSAVVGNTFSGYDFDTAAMDNLIQNNAHRFDNMRMSGSNALNYNNMFAKSTNLGSATPKQLGSGNQFFPDMNNNSNPSPDNSFDADNSNPSVNKQSCQSDVGNLFFAKMIQRKIQKFRVLFFLVKMNDSK